MIILTVIYLFQYLYTTPNTFSSATNDKGDILKVKKYFKDKENDGTG